MCAQSLPPLPPVPGTTPPPHGTPGSSATELIDDPGEWPSFSQRCDPEGKALTLREKDEAMQAEQGPVFWASQFTLQGMYCPACALTIEDALMRVPGVASVQVNGVQQRTRVVWQADRIRPSALIKAIEAAGYGATPGNDGQAFEQRRAANRLMLWRWLVAGFCMMQVMMYAWPAYTVNADGIASDLVQLLRWASWVLTLPVLIFSCGPFFRQAWHDLCQRRIGMDLPIALAIALTFLVSSAGTFEPAGIFGHDVYFDSLTMFVFFLLSGRMLQLRLRHRVAGELDALANRMPEQVERLSDPDDLAAGSTLVALRQLRVRDVVRIKPGEGFPGDGTIVDGATWVDEALLTGESRPVQRQPGDTVIAGSFNRSASVLVRLDRLGNTTRYAQIVDLMETAAMQKPYFAQLADRIAGPFLLAVIVLAGLAMLWWWPQDPARAVMVGVAVLVVTCPCALALATPSALLAAAGALSRRGVLVANLQALEFAPNATLAVFDKTGTLTEDRLLLGQVQVRAGSSAVEALGLALRLASQSLHPVSRALVEETRRQHPELAQETQPHASMLLEGLREIPGQGIEAHIDGITYRLGSAAFCKGLGSASAAQAARVPASAATADMAASDEAALARVMLADTSGWLASFHLSETIRADAAATVSIMRQLGLKTALLSGDQPQAAAQMAQRLGIDIAMGGCSPQDKLDQLQRWQAQGERIVMVGDGLNDGPVLAKANVSFAVGQAVPLARAQADFIVNSTALLPIASTLLVARRTVRVMRENLAWAFGYNLLFIPMALVGWMPAWLAGLGMAASSLIVIANAARLTRYQPLAGQPAGATPAAPPPIPLTGAPAPATRS
ncbi:cation-translocating P-type ATPase [Corticibacter populi]|uniref:Cation-translocating P-type ATPase n=1 Tax=Corticibacter populi TaxID=1550736 RepID=A0A3M6R0P8_9BURK|nr:cation-translocating P-type ATPase [Corticibacter populi]RMX08781.1 cation-translocating P-type ATPase [Corticibacter populi]RZS36141.1 Cu2+-exporting ATPase [Corticibacter populi]